MYFVSHILEYSILHILFLQRNTKCCKALFLLLCIKKIRKLIELNFFFFGKRRTISHKFDFYAEIDSRFILILVCSDIYLSNFYTTYLREILYDANNR